MNRRDLLKGIFTSSALALPIYKLIEILIKNDSFSPLGAPTIESTRNYIQFNFYGGPTRWCYDHFLSPYENRIIHNPMTFNQINPNISPDKQIHKTYKYKNINVPLLWDEDLLSKRKMSNLLDNSLTIRGVHLEGTSGHPMNSSKMVAPSIGGLSIDGILSDMSKKPLSSITVGDTPANRAYRSRRNSNIKISGNVKNRLEYLLSPFHLDSKEENKNNELEQIVDEAIKVLNKSKESKNLKSDLKKARVFFRDNISNFLNEYNSLISKYKEIIDKALKYKIKGIDDSPVPTIKLPIIVKGNVEIEDVLGPYRINNIYFMNEDLREILDKIEVTRLAEDFALAEFLSKYGLTSSVVFSDKNEIGEMFKNVSSKRTLRDTDIIKSYNPERNETTLSTKSKYRKETPQLSFDSHSVGSVINLLTCAKYYYVFSSCLDEFISTLKSIEIYNKTLFDETVIHVTSEFDRVPNSNLSGSGHNEEAHVSTFYSGIIDGPLVLGNIYIGTNNKDKQWGTIGSSAPVKALGSKTGISHLSSSLSCLLRIPPIVRRSPSLIKIENEKVIPIIELAKNIGDSNENTNS